MNTPRPYLSFSQMNLFLRDKNLYYQTYWENLAQYKSKELELGKRFAKTLETGVDPEGDAEFETMSKLIPDYPGREFLIDVSYEGIPLRGYFDGWDEKNLILHEVKTGKKWTQKMVDTSLQIDFYCLMIWLKYKTLPKGINLHWMRVLRLEDGSIRLSGEVKTFRTKRTLRDVIRVGGKVKEVWKGIQALGEFTKGDGQC